MEYRTLKQKKLFFKERNIEYITSTKMSDKVQNNIEVYNNLFKHPYTKKYTDQYLKKVENEYVAPAYIAFVSKEIGYGLFADTTIKKDDFIGEYVGVIVENKPDPWCCAWFYAHTNKESILCVDAHDKGNDMRFVNHSDNSNVKLAYVLAKDNLFHLCYIAAKNIYQDEEILVNYGSTYSFENGHKFIP